ncbi:thioredoxin domain-containing protein [Formosa undariae]|uniref:Thioredoxin domain-containing protein n=1 Tax=Formosa undariae TaxID=1325436 RepID=A0ABV5EWB4_9FLAO
MKTQLKYILILTIILSANLVVSQDSNTTFTVSQFANVMSEQPELVVIDVRTPEEFAGGHIEGAINYNWKSENFGSQIANLDKSKEVLVYCLSGARSGKAAAAMRLEGFTKIYEMQGGLMKWRSGNWPEIVSKVADPGMSLEDFQALLNSDKLILVDFYADWCAPCKKMEPYLNEISNDMESTVEVVRIDADKNRALCKALGVDALPVLHVYKNKEQIWNHTGFIDKEGVVQQLQ